MKPWVYRNWHLLNHQKVITNYKCESSPEVKRLEVVKEGGKMVRTRTERVARGRVREWKRAQEGQFGNGDQDASSFAWSKKPYSREGGLKRNSGVGSRRIMTMGNAVIRGTEVARE